MPFVLHLDCESHPVTPDDPAPPVVCLQACLAPEPDLVDWGGEPVLVDADPSWRWSEWQVQDLIGPAPESEATEHDDPAEEHRAPREINPDLVPLMWDADDAVDVFRWALEETPHVLCGVNLPYDLLVLIEEGKRRGLDLTPAVFDACATGRLADTEVDEKLLTVAQGREEHKFGMEAMARRRLGLDLGDDKHGPAAWRVRYRELERWPENDTDAWDMAVVRGVVTREQYLAAQQGTPWRGHPIEPGEKRTHWTWPYHARRYALMDVVIDRELRRLQRDDAVRLFGSPRIPDSKARAVFRFCLHLQSTTGVITDYHQACEASSSLAAAADKLRAVLVKAGLMNRKEVWSGVGSVSAGALVTIADRPEEEYEFVHRATVKGKPNENGRSAVVQRVGDPQQSIPGADPAREVVPLASLRLCAEQGKGLHLSRDMAEVRRRIEENLTIAGLFQAHSSDGGHLTAQNFVKTDRETLDLVSGLTDDPGLRALGALSKVEKLKSTYVDQLCRQGVVRWRYDVLKETGRTSSASLKFFAPNDEGVLISFKEGTNVQNFPGRDALERAAKQVAEQTQVQFADDEEREAWVSAWVRLHDPRRMVVARPGHLFAVHDYKAIELACMARVLNVFTGNPSSLAAVINSGRDPHLVTGVRVHPILHKGETLTYEELLIEKEAAEANSNAGRPLTALQKRVRKTRKMCKVVNFGFLGAMGAAKFVLYAWQGYGERVELDVAKALRRAFLDTYPEVPEYFKRIDLLLKRNLPVVQVGTGRVRRGCTYAAACNSYFQGLAADGAAQAAWLLARQSYVGPGPLFGSRTLIFEHDAFLQEFACEFAEELQWLEAEIEEARLVGAANGSAYDQLQVRRRYLRAAAGDDESFAWLVKNKCAVPETRAPQSDEVGRLMVVGMSTYLTDRKRPELSVVVGTDGKVSTRWEK